MRPAKYILICIICSIFFQRAHAQDKNKTPAGVSDIFDDLHIDDPATNSVLQHGEDSIQKIKNNIFVKAVISKNRCFLGEPILLTYTLFSALQSTSTISKAPSFAGFSVADMEPDNEQVNRKKQDGKNYRVFIIQQLQLVPLQEGVLTIDPVSVYNEVNYKVGQKEFHYGGSVEEKAITIYVDALPVAGRPVDFTGATGVFSIHVKADSVAAAGENNTLHIEIAGTGNFTAVSIPEIKWPAGCEHFSVSNSLQTDKKLFPPTGKKMFDIPFVASKEGILVIPAMRICFFDVKKKNYQFAHSDSITIHVSPALRKQLPAEPSSPVKKQFPLYNLLVGGVVLIMVLLALFLYNRKRNSTAGAEKPSAPVATELIKTKKEIIDKAKVESLNAFDKTGEYVTAFKKMMMENLQQQTDLPLSNEETLLAQIRVKDPELSIAASELFAKCNNLLYAPVNLNVGTKKEMEEELVAISARINQTFL